MSPIDIYSMSPDEVMMEANRRREARELGIKLEQAVIRKSTAEIDRDRTKREKAIQVEIVKTYRAFGFVVYELSQPRATMQTEGIPDLHCMHPRRGVALWHESKTLDGELRPAQQEFRNFCRATNQLHTYGGVSAAEDMLEVLGIARRVGACLESISPLSE